MSEEKSHHLLIENTTTDAVDGKKFNNTELEEKNNEEEEDKKDDDDGSSSRVLLPHMLVTAKELRIEHYLEEIFDGLEVPTTTTTTNNTFSASELALKWKEEVKKKLASVSVTLSHRTAPLVEILMEKKLGEVMESNFVSITVPDQDSKNMVTSYQECFETWVDDGNRVHFRAMNTTLLGKLSAKDVFILTFFSQCTNRRVKNDNVLQLGLVVRSSS